MGVNPELLDTLFLVGIFDYILVEGDGSKEGPLRRRQGMSPLYRPYFKGTWINRA